MSRKLKVFAWMTDKELHACAERCKIPTTLQRQKIIRDLEKRGWWRADVSDLTQVKLQRMKES